MEPTDHLCWLITVDSAMESGDCFEDGTSRHPWGPVAEGLRPPHAANHRIGLQDMVLHLCLPRNDVWYCIPCRKDGFNQYNCYSEDGIASDENFIFQPELSKQNWIKFWRGFLLTLICRKNVLLSLSLSHIADPLSSKLSENMYSPPSVGDPWHFGTDLGGPKTYCSGSGSGYGFETLVHLYNSSMINSHK